MATTIPKTMRAAVCQTTGPISVLQLQEIPTPMPQAGQVLIKILGFGINRAEMYTRQGHSPGVTFPRIVGIECVGKIAAYPTPGPSDALPLGTRVATCMGGLGRTIPGSYAEYTCVAASNVRAFPCRAAAAGDDKPPLPVASLAALPEMLQTTWGSLRAGLDLRAGESILVRGATSSIGLCALQLARAMGAGRVAGTTRREGRAGMLREAGADEVFIDGGGDGSVAEQVARAGKGGFDKVLELVGTTTLRDSVRCARQGGLVCMTGIQGGEWELKDFSPVMDLPNRVRLAAYGGGPEDFLAMPWEELVGDVEAGRIKVPVRAFKLDEIQEVHRILESGGGGAKMVVVVAED